MVLQIKRIDLCFGKKELRVDCLMDGNEQYLIFRVTEINYDREKEKLSLFLDCNFRYLRNNFFGMVAPKLSDDDLSEILILTNLEKYFWYYSRDSTIHHLVGVDDFVSAANRHRNETIYSIKNAIEYGFLPQLEGKRILSYGEVIHKLERNGLRCTSSSLSSSAILVTGKPNQNIEVAVRNLLQEPTMTNLESLPNKSQCVHLWGWKPEKNWESLS